MDQFLAYNFNDDNEFIQGLQAVLSKTGEDQSDKDRLTLQAKLFFFERKSGIHITPQEYQEYMQTQGSSKNATQEGELTTELSFAEIKHLIETGQAHLIPNNKTIPDRLNESVPSVSTAKVRRKPWEVAKDPSEEGDNT